MPTPVDCALLTYSHHSDHHDTLSSDYAFLRVYKPTFLR